MASSFQAPWWWWLPRRSISLHAKAPRLALAFLLLEDRGCSCVPTARSQGSVRATAAMQLWGGHQGNPRCFPPGSGITAQICCSNGGLADCFAHEYTFVGCCPPGAEGSDPASCFANHLQEELCCTGQGLPYCFAAGFTRRSCCYSYWRSVRADVSIRALQRAVRNDEDWVLSVAFPERRGAFFAYLFAELGIEGDCAEIGVAKGAFASDFYNTATRIQARSCRYFLVDVWREATAEEHYVDTANVADALQIGRMKLAIDRMADFWQQVSFLQLGSQEAARLFEDEQFAFVYIDARHDYCAAYEDIVAYWPKVRRGGVLAGDDCLNAMSLQGQDWTVCADGSRRAGGVCQAITDFARLHGLHWRKINNQFVMAKL